MDAWIMSGGGGGELEKEKSQKERKADDWEMGAEIVLMETG